MTTLADLKTDIADWTARDDLGAQMASFVRLAETVIRRKIRVLDMQVHVDEWQLVEGVRSLPTGFLGFRSVAIATPYASRSLLGNDHQISYKPPDKFFEDLRTGSILDNASIEPSYTISDGNFYMNPAVGPAQSGGGGGATGDALDITYYQAFDALTNGSDTNWLLTNHYDIYLYLCLSNAFKYIMDFETAAAYKIDAEMAIDALHRADEKKIRSGGPKKRYAAGLTP